MVVFQDTLIQIMLVGLSKDHPLTAPDALELVDQILRRCEAVHTLGNKAKRAIRHYLFEIFADKIIKLVFTLKHS